MITHANLVTAIAGCNQYLESFNETLGENDSYLSFLPLAHVFDRCAGNTTGSQASASKGSSHADLLASIHARVVCKQAVLGVCPAQAARP